MIECEFCKKRFKSPNSLSKHLKKCEKNKTVEKKDYTQMVENLKKTTIKIYGVDNAMKDKVICDKQHEFLRYKEKDIQAKLNKHNIKIKKFNGYKNVSNFFCSSCSHEWEDIPYYVVCRINKCPKCSPIFPKSSIENEIYQFCQSITNNIILNDRKVLKGKEIDILLPDVKVGIEINGLYYHSDQYKDKFYHQEKTIDCRSQNINLIHIFEDEWVNKKDIVKSIIKSKLNLYEKKINVQKCKIEKLKLQEAREFCDENHLNGFTYGIYYGLKDMNDEIVSVIIFKKLRTKDKNVYEIIRYCNKINYNVVGGFNILFNYFLGKYTPDVVFSYSDARLSENKIYRRNSFKFMELTEPNYYYINNGVRENKQTIKKHFNEDKLKTISKERELMEEFLREGQKKIWDCGNYIYKFRKSRENNNEL
jgi:hypothetical protein